MTLKQNDIATVIESYPASTPKAEVIRFVSSIFGPTASAQNIEKVYNLLNR